MLITHLCVCSATTQLYPSHIALLFLQCSSSTRSYHPSLSILISSSMASRRCLLLFGSRRSMLCTSGNIIIIINNSKNQTVLPTSHWGLNTQRRTRLYSHSQTRLLWWLTVPASREFHITYKELIQGSLCARPSVLFPGMKSRLKSTAWHHLAPSGFVGSEKVVGFDSKPAKISSGCALMQWYMPKGFR